MDILQLYTSLAVFDKTNYSSENRKAFQMPESLSSQNGFLSEDTLVLPVKHKELSIQSAGTLIIRDHAGPDKLAGDAEDPKIVVISNASSLQKIGLVKIRKSGDQYELFLDYTSNSSLLGMPRRTDHKIAELRPGHPVRLRINGKSDFSFSGRRQRTYYEFDHVFEWVGSAARLEFADFSESGSIKTIPMTTCKLVDERKHFR